tara:strand:- start:394 stop:798 length:405 start_codon:yes stop_codon:yes gene_type:complete
MTNILIAISVVLNGVLLAFLFGTVPLLLYISAAINVLLLWYIRKSLQTVRNIEEDLMSLFETVEGFSEDLEEVHGMQMFYGEPVLQDLINNSKTTVNGIIDVLEKYYDVRTEEIDEERDETKNETEEEEEPILY